MAAPTQWWPTEAGRTCFACPALSSSALLAGHQSENRRKEGNGLFNDALNTFYIRLYGVRHMVKDHSDNERWNPLPPHGLLFSINNKGSFICTIPDSIYHSLCYTSHGALAIMRNSSLGPRWRINPTTHRTMSERSYHRATFCSLDLKTKQTNILFVLVTCNHIAIYSNM